MSEDICTLVVASCKRKLLVSLQPVSPKKRGWSQLVRHWKVGTVEDASFTAAAVFNIDFQG